MLMHCILYIKKCHCAIIAAALNCLCHGLWQKSSSSLFWQTKLISWSTCQPMSVDGSSWCVLFKHYLSSSSQLIVALHLWDILQNSSTPASPFSSGSDLINVICSQWCLLWSEWPCCCFAWHERLTCAFQVPDRSHTVKCKSLPENWQSSFDHCMVVLTETSSGLNEYHV